jgi:autotransporter-associated beta strand protein
VISGQSDVDFTGAGGITLSGVNTYTGMTTIDNSQGSEVTLIANNTLPTTSPVHITSSGLLDLFGINQTIASLDSGGADTSVVQDEGTTPSNLTILGSDHTNFNGTLEDGQSANAHLGLTLAAGNTGILTLNNVANLNGGPINVVAGRLTIQAVGALGGPSSITVGATSTNSQIHFDGLSGTLVFQNTLNQPAANSPFTLNGLGGYNDTNNGQQPGALFVDNGGNLTIPSNISITADSGIAAGAGSSFTLTGSISGTGALVAGGANATGLITLTGNNSGYTGGTQLNGGTLTAISTSSIGTGDLAVNNPNTAAGTAVVLNLSNAAQSVGSLSGVIAAPSSGTNTATINLFGTALTVNQAVNGAYAGVIAGTGSLTENGTATLTLTGTNSYTGPTTLNGGALNFKGLVNLGTSNVINFNGGAIQYASGNVADISTETVTLATNGGTIDTNGNNVTFNHSIGQGGAGSLTKAGAGSLTLAAAASFGGSTTISGGTLNLAAVNALPTSSPVTNNAALLISANNSLNSVVGTGTTTVNLSRTLTVANALTQSLLTNNGVTQVNGSGGTVGQVLGGGTLNLGAAGGLTLPGGVASSQGALSIAAGGVLVLNNSGHSSFTLGYGNNPSPDATIRKYLQNGFNAGHWDAGGALPNPASGSITSATAGSTNSFSLGYADGSDGAVTGLAAGKEEIKFTYAGDASLDGQVNLTDLSILASHFGSTGAKWDQGDFSYDSTVNLSDLSILASHFGEGVGNPLQDAQVHAQFAADLALVEASNPAFGTAVGNAIPEPAALTLLSMGGFGLLQRRRRRKA